MNLRSLVIKFGVILAMGVSGMGQAPQANIEVYSHNGPVSPTPGQVLQDYQIPLDKESLINALGNPDAKIRASAALKLSEDKATDAVPAITQALASERTQATRVEIAFELAKLGQEEGLAALKEICEDKNYQSDISPKMRAARYMLKLDHEDCLGSMIELLPPYVSNGWRLQALDLLQYFRHISENDAQKIFPLVVANLTDSESIIRVVAGHVLGNLGNPAAAAYLQSAIANEKDENARSAMMVDLKRLQEKNVPFP